MHRQGRGAGGPHVDGRLRIAGKERHHDGWDPKIEPHDPYGPGAFVTRNGSDEAIDD